MNPMMILQVCRQEMIEHGGLISTADWKAHGLLCHAMEYLRKQGYRLDRETRGN